MQFHQAIHTCFIKYANFNGRASRSEYWWFFLFVVLVNLVASTFIEQQGAITGIITLALFLPNLAVQVRRLHDINRSGWWILIIAVPLIGAIIMIYWTIKTGSPTTNQYGEYPGTEFDT